MKDEDEDWIEFSKWFREFMEILKMEANQK